MKRRGRNRAGWIAIAGAIGGLAISRPAHAVIPLDTQLTPGTLRGVAHGNGDPWAYSYWEYLPTSFDPLATDELYPLIIFLAGIGEFDDLPVCPGGAALCDPSDCGGDGLCRNLTWGPQQLIRTGIWDDVSRPFIVISPQNPVPTSSTQPWNIDNLDGFMTWLVDNYPIDPRRLYLMGMSQGGRAVLQYTAAYPRRFAAVAPMPGGVVEGDVTCHFQDTALWVFHGENDQDGHLGPGVFSPCSMAEYLRIYQNPDLYLGFPACVDAIGSPRPEGRITMFDNVGHFSWVPATDPVFTGFPASEWTADQGCGIDVDYREYRPELDADGVYSWFADLDRPRVVAPDDLEVEPDGSPLALTATVTDDDPVSYTWTQRSGPAVTLANTDQATVQVSDWVPDSAYTFEVFVVDADQQWDLDEVTVHVTEAVDPGTSGGDSGGPTGGNATDVGGSTGSTTGGSTTGSGGTTDGGTTTSNATTSTGGSSSGGSSSGGSSSGGSSSGGSSSGGSSSGSGSSGDGSSGGVATTGTTGGNPGSTDTTDGGADATGSGTTASTNGGTTGGTTASGPASLDDTAADPNDEGDDTGSGEQPAVGDGCSCRSTDDPAAPAAWGWLGLFALGLGRRRLRVGA